MSRLHYYLVEPFTGDPSALAAHLGEFGITVKYPSGHQPCIEHRDENGRRVREVGDVTVYADGRIVAWPNSDATADEQVTVLRTAERVITHGFDGPGEPGWTVRVTGSGRRYRRTTVVVFLDGADQADAAVEVARQQDVDGVFLQLTTATSVTEVGAMNTAFDTGGAS